MALGISFRKNKKAEITPQESAQQEPPTPPGAPVPLMAKEISATTERLKQLRNRLRRNGAVEAYRLAEHSLPEVLSDLDAKVAEATKNRSHILAGEGNPDDELRRLGKEKKQAEQNVSTLKAAALRELDSVHKEYVTIVNKVAPVIWNEWRQLRKELLAMLERWGDFDERLGVPVASLARETEQFYTDFSDAHKSIPDAGALQAPVRVPRLSRGWDWGTFKKIVVGIRQWLV